jgi:hypothetical protein
MKPMKKKMMIMMRRGLERESLLESLHWKSNALNKCVCLIQNPTAYFVPNWWDVEEILEILGTGDCRCSDPQAKKG